MRTDVYHVNPMHLVLDANDYNQRYEYGDLEALAQSIKVNGVQQPLIVKKERGQDSYVVKSGKRRTMAIQKLLEEGHTDFKVPVIYQRADITPAQEIIQLFVHNDSKPFTMLEQADVFGHAMKAGGMTVKQIAEATGQSKAHISNCLRLTNINHTTRERIVSGKISASLVIEELKKAETTGEKVEEELNQLADNLEEGAKVRKKNLSSGAMDKKVLIADVEILYHDIATMTEGACDPAKLNVLQVLGEFLRGRVDLEALASACM